jgi:hypothetical protein
MTLVANPHSSFAAVSAQRGEMAVTISRVPTIGNASAKVSATEVPFNSSNGSGAAVESVAVKAINLPK